MYAISVVRGKWQFVSGRPRGLWHSIFHLSFCVQAGISALFSAIAIIWELEEVFANTDGFPRAVNLGLGLGFPLAANSPWFRSRS